VLPQFVAYLEAAGASTVTVDLAMAWARLPADAGTVTVAHRLGAVRGFARYLHTIDPTTAIPPVGLLPARQQRHTPYLYSPEELARLLVAARALRPPLRAANYEALIGLLAASGMRLGEALALTRGDVDLSNGIITIRHAKFDRTRLVPLHASVTAALRRYRTTRDRLCPTPQADRFFLSSIGTAMLPKTFDATYRQLTLALGLCTPTCRPRVHDLRHSLAVRTLIDWQRDGVDVATGLPVLSTYLGHVSPASTYWYLTAVPELMQLAAAGLDRHPGGRK
jgi:integrase